MEKSLPSIPAKRYFTIGEVSELCGVKPYVLRYWEQEFTQLKPMKRRGNRRYYQHHEVLLIRRIRELLYEQGFTISGARNRLVDGHHARHDPAHDDFTDSDIQEDHDGFESAGEAADGHLAGTEVASGASQARDEMSPAQMRQELISIRVLLSV
jgi:DNA-binding transcriptional MerR regulator